MADLAGFYFVNRLVSSYTLPISGNKFRVKGCYLPCEHAVAHSIDQLNFEQAIAELEKIVHQLEGGSVKLEQAIADYERGNALRQRCENLLNEAELRVQKLLTGKPGGIQAEPLDKDIPF